MLRTTLFVFIALLPLVSARAQEPGVSIIWPPVWTSDSQFGIPIEDLGDLDGDGVHDLGIGARGEDVDDVYTGAGHAYVYSGATHQRLYTLESPQPVPDGGFGAIRPMGGDLNGDDVPDFFVEDPGAAQIRLYDGATGALLRSYPSPGDEHGIGVGDLTGDGKPDIVLGQVSYGDCGGGNGTPGRVRVLNGNTGQEIAAITGGCPFGFLGWSVRPLGDITGDGYADFAAGAAGVAPSLRVFDGQTRTLLRTFPMWLHGVCVFNVADFINGVVPYGRVGDADGDGTSEFALARPDSNFIRLYSAPSLTYVRSIPNPDPARYCGIGRGVMNLGDFDGDGRDDLGVSALLSESGDGVFLILSGATDAVLAEMQASGPGQGYHFANHIAIPGDLDGDSVPEAVFGVPSAGQVYVYSGASFTVVAAEPPPTTPVLSMSAAPNPVVGSLTVRFTLAAPAHVRLALYDALGRKVAMLLDEERGAGSHAATFDASGLPSGAYVTRIEAGGESLAHRLTVLQ